MPLVDVFMTTKNRGTLLRQTLDSFFENTDRDLFRFTLVRDGAFANTSFANADERIDHVITSRENEGLGPSINRALAHIDATNKYYEVSASKFMSAAPITSFTCYVQDDLLFTKDWLKKLLTNFLLFEKSHKLAFASGLECVEHKTTGKLPNGMLLKNWVRAANMFGRRETWMSMWPIPRFDPETGRERAKPNDGIGSGVDWHFLRNHENSVDKTGRTCLVIPGLVLHAGFSVSTWLNRELPESDADKKMIEEHKHDT